MANKSIVGIWLTLILLAASSGSMPATGSPIFDQAGSACPSLPPPGGVVVNVSTVAGLVSAVDNAASGTTILVADGYYDLDGAYLRFDTPGVTLRSTSGNRQAVVLDGNYATTEILQIVASDVTIADLTLREAFNHPIHVMSSESSHTLNTLIYNVHIIDPGQQAIKINPLPGGFYTDEGVIACSHIELTESGRGHIRDNCYTGGVDAHQARGWTVRDNRIEGFWCAAGLSEHAIHFWKGGRDTTIERNILLDNARGAGLGLVTSDDGRTYPDDPCPAASGYVDDYGGVIRNNFIAANNSGLFASEYGFDCGICLWNACNAQALHNTVFTANPDSTFSSIEWRFPNTAAQILNNLVNDTMRQRDGAAAVQSGNLTEALVEWFVAAGSGDLHLMPAAVAAIDQVWAPAGVSGDIDGEARPVGQTADIGADERVGPGFSLDASPPNQAIEPGGQAVFSIALEPTGAFAAPVHLDASSPSPDLRVGLSQADGIPPFQSTLAITDTHPGPALPGLWYSLPITASSGTITQTTSVSLLVGGWRVYLPIAAASGLRESSQKNQSLAEEHPLLHFSQQLVWPYYPFLLR